MADQTATDLESEIAAAEAQIAALQTKRDIASLDGIKALKTLLNTGKLATFEADLAALITQIGTTNFIGQNVNSIIANMQGTRDNIERETARIQLLVDAQAAQAAS